MSRSVSFARASTLAARAHAAGLSLIEVMVALTLGLLVSAGIITLFSATSKTSNVQDALARLQENGRYAITRINDDLRMAGGQYCGNADSTGWTDSGANGAVYPGITVTANVNGVSTGASGSFPDSGGLLGIPPVGLPGGTTYPIGPADFMRGYDCDDGGGCAPAVPAGSAPDGLPAEGDNDGQRVRGADVLTIRYQAGTGWPFTVNAVTTPPKITLVPTIVGSQNLDDPVNFSANDRALLLTCGGGQVFKAAVSGNTLTPTDLLNLSSYKPAATIGGFDVRVFNFSKDFRTVSYYLVYRADPQIAGRLIPTLARNENGVRNDIVQGVERLDFIYGVQYADATLHYLTADEIEANSNNTNCSPPSPGLGLPPGTVEASCLWRSVRSIEAHMLLDTVNNIGLSDADVAYRYTGKDGSTDMLIPPGPETDMGFGLKAGRMMRREFVSLIATRNSNH